MRIAEETFSGLDGQVKRHNFLDTGSPYSFRSQCIRVCIMALQGNTIGFKRFDRCIFRTLWQGRGTAFNQSAIDRIVSASTSRNTNGSSYTPKNGDVVADSRGDLFPGLDGQIKRHNFLDTGSPYSFRSQCIRVCIMALREKYNWV